MTNSERFHVIKNNDKKLIKVPIIPELQVKASKIDL